MTVDEAEKERNAMTCELKEKYEEIFLLKSNLISLNIKTHEITRIMEEMKKQLVMKDEDLLKFWYERTSGSLRL